MHVLEYERPEKEGSEAVTDVPIPAAANGNAEIKLALSVQEVADALGIGRSLAWRLVNDQTLPSFRLGRRVLVPRASLQEWIAQVANR
jgi:excisionase family DNA binding protein